MGYREIERGRIIQLLAMEGFDIPTQAQNTKWHTARIYVPDMPLGCSELTKP